MVATLHSPHGCAPTVAAHIDHQQWLVRKCSFLLRKAVDYRAMAARLEQELIAEQQRNAELMRILESVNRSLAEARGLIGE